MLDSDAVQKALRNRNTVFLKADYTSYAGRHRQADRQLRAGGHSACTCFIRAGKPNEPVVMPELLTTDIVLNAFSEADLTGQGGWEGCRRALSPYKQVNDPSLSRRMKPLRG